MQLYLLFLYNPQGPRKIPCHYSGGSSSFRRFGLPSAQGQLAADEAWLVAYGWVDANHTIARIPIAAAAEIVMGKASGHPVAVVRGLDQLVTVEDGPGARDLVRTRDEDLFPLGTFDVVLPFQTVLRAEQLAAQVGQRAAPGPGDDLPTSAVEGPDAPVDETTLIPRRLQLASR